MGRVHRLLQAVAETDSAFAIEPVRGRRAWVGPCIHCRRKVVVPLAESEAASATLEHILPRNHGGGDDLENLALACATCNHEKGRKLDCRRRDDPALQEVVARLRALRASRFRPPA